MSLEDGFKERGECPGTHAIRSELSELQLSQTCVICEQSSESLESNLCFRPYIELLGEFVEPGSYQWQFEPKCNQYVLVHKDVLGELHFLQRAPVEDVMAAMKTELPEVLELDEELPETTLDIDTELNS